MKSIVRRSLSLAAALLLLLTFASPARADLVVTLVPGASTDLSNVHVGDTLQFYTVGSSSSPGSGEFLTVFPDVHLFYSSNLDITSAIGLAGWNAQLDLNPNLVLWTMYASDPGDVILFNGFSDCLGLPNDTTGCAVTNLSATRPADSNVLSFTVLAVPEPSSIALLSVAFLALGFCRRKVWIKGS